MKNKQTVIIFNLVLATAIMYFSNGCSSSEYSANDKSVHKTHWSYEGEGKPQNWSSLSPDYYLCAEGKEQSPVNIEETTVVNKDLPNLIFNYSSSKIKLENNGHTIKAVPEPQNYFTYEGKKLNLLQFHFHSLSEHTLNGKHFPMEIHFVHKSDDGSLAVIGVFVKEGEENSYFENFWENLPKNNSDEFEVEDKIELIKLLPDDKQTFRYSGSFTTPPCTEGISWFVISQPIEMSPEQINEFKKLYDNNYRPLNPVNTRKIVFDISK